MALVCFCSVVAPWAMLVSGLFFNKPFTVFFGCVLRVQETQAAQLDKHFFEYEYILGTIILHLRTY